MKTFGGWFIKPIIIVSVAFATVASAQVEAGLRGQFESDLASMLTENTVGPYTSIRIPSTSLMPSAAYRFRIASSDPARDAATVALEFDVELAEQAIPYRLELPEHTPDA